MQKWFPRVFFNIILGIESERRSNLYIFFIKFWGWP